MTQNKFQSGESSDMQNAIPETLRLAVESAGVRPITSLDELTQDASQNSTLQQAFDDQVHSDIHERLQRDPDFRRSRYPNAESVFGKDKKK